MQSHDNGLDDAYGLVHIEGFHNSLIGNHFSEVIDQEYIRPQGVRPVIVRVASGYGNYIASNYMVGVTESAPAPAGKEDSCYSAQVGAMLSIANAQPVPLVTVQVDAQAGDNIVLDSGREDQVVLDRTENAFRPTPAPAGKKEKPRLLLWRGRGFCGLQAVLWSLC